MAKRHRDAIAIQQGACNPSGIAHSIVDACAEIRGEPNHAGTAQITSDPAVQLMVHQLAYICGVTSGAEDLRKGSYSEAMRACEAAQKGEVESE
jgi:hypothetical protein